jgi:sulfopyruvate decarboxylase subunit alpha
MTTGMMTETAAQVVDALKDMRVEVAAGLPDSMLGELHTAVQADPAFRYVRVGNEAEGAAIVAGAWIAGARSVLMMENSGLRSSCEALARLGLASGVPVTMLMPYRGDVGESFVYGVNHGLTMEPLLHAMRIPYLFVDRLEDIAPAVRRAVTHAVTSLYHVAVVFREPMI